VTNNLMLLNYSPGQDPVAAIRAALVSGAATSGGVPTWLGTGITSSSATLVANRNYGVGYVDGADNVTGGPTGNTIELGWMLYGDLNGDGQVDGTDFGILVHNFGLTGTQWDQGDFNYDGQTDGTDFGMLVHSFGQVIGGGSAAISPAQWAALENFGASIGIPVSVPEPASFSLIVLGGPTLLTRRRRKL
jgi:hypothetical protein